ncbi:HAD family hydrolase [Sphingomonas sp. PAMC 26605]|uniref:HAD family hydrolase n=1 Tax=Sphingomonas sp. PAMC 26605 TaxID=1112214 RepID=UPI0012F50C1F|nr:HAD family hydrolase [Sphingomonas sp. PAMC 26605]
MDNTLFDWLAVWHASFSAMFNKLVELSGIPEDVLAAEIRTVHQRVGTSEYSYLISELPLLRIRSGSTPVLDFYEPAISAFREARRAALQLYEGVFEYLIDLKKNGTLIIGYTESLWYYTQYRLKRTGLDKIMDKVYSPPDHDFPDGVDIGSLRFYSDSHYNLDVTQHLTTPPGELKPNPDILRKILSDAHASPEQAVYVGDSPVKDIWMAQQAGVLDAHALYGEARHTEAYTLLKKVSHWNDADIEREGREVLSCSVNPTITLPSRLDQLSNFVTFERFPR